ncbi:MAG: SpoIIE family protein phosphatase [Bacteroidales bacterium]|nr:SpoIIE family protein phosphatase [Bacteroidales bacterium]
MLLKQIKNIKELNFNDYYVRTNALVTMFFTGAIFILSLFTIIELGTLKTNNYIFVGTFLLVTLVSFLLFKNTKNIRFGSWSIVLITFLFEYFLFFELTKNAYGFFWYFAFPLLAITVLGKWKGTILTFLLIISTIVIIRYQLFEVRVRFTPYFLTRFFTGYFFVWILSFIFEFVAEKTRTDYNNLIQENEKHIKKIEKFNVQLKEAHNELMISQMDLQEVNQNLDESIEYAKIIQSKLFPSNDLLQTTLKNYFLIFMPLSKVSGDFYYVNQLNEYMIFAVGDCTGHGIPGALLSVLSISLLHDIIHRDEVNSANKVLDALRERVKATFTFFSTKDLHGLDLALCAIDTKTNNLQYSGANIPLFLYRNNEVIQYDAVKNPVGYFYKEIPFVNNEITLQKGDKIYLSSDGFFDQIGGEKRRKLTKRRFVEILQEVAPKSFDEQKNVMLKYFFEWKGTHRQLDDVTILAFEWNG